MERQRTEIIKENWHVETQAASVAGAMAGVKAAAGSEDARPMGKVWLVGAGPGDPGLLTLKAQAVLSQAEVVVFDRLIGEDILTLLPDTAQRIDVGKESGFHPVPQEEISQILLDQARAGRQVVRLKGGDSFLFGRGGEELVDLEQAGIPFEVVPGITSALAAAAYAGIPVTHRDYASSVHIITGHKKADGRLDLDYPTLARLSGTLVFLMSLATLDQVVQGLIQAGMPPDTDCALIENGTLPQQRKALATLDNILQCKEEMAIQSPAVFLVGPVCRFSSQLDWFSRLPLHGCRILVAQPEATASRLASQLRQLGAAVTLAPVIRTSPLAFTLPDLAPYTTLVFTSPAGVHAYFQALLGMSGAGPQQGSPRPRQGGAGQARPRQDSRILAGKKLATVGKETAQALLQYGLHADFVPSCYQGAVLAAEMLAQGFLSQADRLLLPQAAQPSPQLGQALADAGIPYEHLAVYETAPQDIAPVPAGYDWITFTSASCVDGFCRGLKGSPAGLPALCIGPTTAAQAAAWGMTATIAPQATLAAMVETIVQNYGSGGLTPAAANQEVSSC